MPMDIVMPRLSDTMTEGTIARWLKKPGDAVKRGEALAQIETDKALMEYEAFEDGTLGEIRVGDGSTAPLGEVIAVLYRAGETPSGAAPAPAARAEPAPTPAARQRGGSTETGGAAGDGAESVLGERSRGAGAATRAGDTARGAAAMAGDGRARGVETAHENEASPAGATANGAGRVRASPLARRLAAERGVDLASVRGSGPGGRVVRADVEGARAAPGTSAGRDASAGGAFADGGSASAARDAATGGAPPGASTTRVAGVPTEAGADGGLRDVPADPLTPTLSLGARGPLAAPAPGGVEPFSRMQAVIAKRMVESKSTIPHFQVTFAMDMTAAMQFRSESNAYLGEEHALSVNDLFVKAVALALREHPTLNASLDGDGIRRSSEINIGNAVAIPNGLVVPVIRNADAKSLPEIGRETRALVRKAREGVLTLADYEGGTFTISNLGMFGAESFSAIVNPPQAAILAIGAAAEEPVVRDRQLAVGHVCRVTLSADHRIVYGAEAASFLKDLKALMERPFGLVY